MQSCSKHCACRQIYPNPSEMAREIRTPCIANGAWKGGSTCYSSQTVLRPANTKNSVRILRHTHRLRSLLRETKNAFFEGSPGRSGAIRGEPGGAGHAPHMIFSLFDHFVGTRLLIGFSLKNRHKITSSIFHVERPKERSKAKNTKVGRHQVGPRVIPGRAPKRKTRR